MAGLLNEIVKLSDEQLAEAMSALAGVRTDDLRFVREALLMEMDARRTAVGTDPTVNQNVGHSRRKGLE